jgi:hypothetical protein
MQDVRKSMAALCEREVRVHVLHAGDGELDLVPALGKPFLQVFALQTETERTFRSERFTELARRRKEKGLVYGGVPRAQRIVHRNGRKCLEWDWEQLQYIAEIAYRLRKEVAAKVAEDFWKRQIKDQRGRLWGKQVPKSATPAQQAIRGLRFLLGERNRTVSPYQQFYRAARWFWRMRRQGLLPPPYGTLAVSTEEPEGFRLEPRPRNWTPGGTARRERERAETKARHHAERLARWQAEKAARVQSRVHKPKL